MHMADVFISPAVGGVMYAATAGSIAYSIKKVKEDIDGKKIPLMGVMGAFVFAAQMINFSIPGTGSSGHIGGGMLLSALLGPYAGFLTMASVLLIQALFFGDGGLLAYGCNVFNLGFYTCFIAYPLIYKLIIHKGIAKEGITKEGITKESIAKEGITKESITKESIAKEGITKESIAKEGITKGIAKKGITKKRIFAASVIASVAGLQLGAFSVVLQTILSGKTELPFKTFLFFMQPIHFAIGLIEGLATAAVILFVWQARPEIIDSRTTANNNSKVSFKKLIICFIIAAVLLGGIIAWFASGNPDGLEWAIDKTLKAGELKESSAGIYKILSDFQNKIAIFPDYSHSRLNENVGTSASGLAGGIITLTLTVIIGLFAALIKKHNEAKRQRSKNAEAGPV